MGIDGIGRRPPVAPAPPAGPAAPAPTAATFDVSRPTGAAAPTATQPASAALERLRAGALDVDGYVEARVREATAHLGALPPARLEEIRTALRERVASDPTLVDLVRTATGKAPSPPAED